jgi:predicted transcriptional regulator
MASQLSIRVNDDLAERLEEFRDQHRFEPTQSEVVREALEEYLEREITDDENEE